MEEDVRWVMSDGPLAPPCCKHPRRNCRRGVHHVSGVAAPFSRASDQQEEVATLESSNQLETQAEKASAELKAQADRLHLIVTVLALDMERDGLLTGVMWDERGLLKGVPQVVYPAGGGDESEDGQRTPP